MECSPSDVSHNPNYFHCIHIVYGKYYPVECFLIKTEPTEPLFRFEIDQHLSENNN